MSRRRATAHARGAAATPGAPPPVPFVTLAVPAPPTPVRAAGRTVLVYELHVANAGPAPLGLARVEIRDAAAPTALASGVRAVVFL